MFSLVIEEGELGMIPKQQAIQIGRNFLDNMANAKTGKVLSAKLEGRIPNFYWHELAKLKKPEVPVKPTLCRIIEFEQAYRPGHISEVWINAYTGEVVGGIQCL